MGSIDRYIFRITLAAFLVVLCSLTAIMWVTQALRQIDLVTSQGQTVLVFFSITGLSIPLLVMIIAPIALVIAVVHVLNKLGGDSEIVVMNAAGMSPWTMFRALIAVAGVVSIFVFVISAYIVPWCWRELRYRATEARADLVANIVQPGRFLAVERGLTFHIRERRTGGRLLGIFLDDWRDPQQRATVLAEEGNIVRNDSGTFLVMERGSIQRYEKGRRDPAIVLFDRYAFELSQFTPALPTMRRYVRERYLWDLIAPNTRNPSYRSERGKFRAELHDRLAAPIYPFVFVIFACAFLGAPRTNRQSRAMAIAAVTIGVGALRLAGFVSAVFSVHAAPIVLLQYAAFVAAAVFGLRSISRGEIIEMPAFVANAVQTISERLAPRTAAA